MAADVSAPSWFDWALAAPRRSGNTSVDGATVQYLEWGDRGAPGLVLVHGGAAHAHWWTFLAPFFAEDWHVVAPDLTGHGNSDRRDRYSHDLWAQEILAVADEAGMARPPVVVGHSLGGLITINTAARHPDRVAAAIIVDSPVRRPDPESEEGRRGSAFRSPGTYASRQEAIDRFRLVPSQPCENDYIVEWIAGHSIHETDAGWTWKFDPSLFRHALIPMNEQLAAVTVRVALIRGSESVVVPRDVAEYMYELMGRRSPVVSIPEAHHHLILDQPLAFVAAVRTLLADWEHSLPLD